MSQVVIENPIINSPYDEPTRHFRFSDEGITDEIVEGRRASSYFVPIAKPRKKGSKQLQFDTEWTQDRIEENKLDTRWPGIPTEGYGFSNDAKGFFGAPSFPAASFQYDGQNLELTISLHY